MLLARWCGKAEGEWSLWAAREQGAHALPRVRVAPVKWAVQCVCHNLGDREKRGSVFRRMLAEGLKERSVCPA